MAQCHSGRPRKRFVKYLFIFMDAFFIFMDAFSLSFIGLTRSALPVIVAFLVPVIALYKP